MKFYQDWTDLYDQTHEHQIQRYCPQFLKGRLLAQEKLKTMLMQNFVGENKFHHGERESCRF